MYQGSSQSHSNHIYLNSTRNLFYSGDNNHKKKIKQKFYRQTYLQNQK